MTEIVVTEEFETWWDGLSAGAQEDVAFVVGLLEAKGVGLGFPHSSAIRGSKTRLRELRVRSSEQPLRILYAFDPWRSAVLLIGGSKAGRGERFYAETVPKAEGLYQEYVRLRESEEKGQMKERAWRDLERKLSPRARARVAGRVEAELLAMDLRAIRAHLGKTQAEMAAALGSSQSRVSELERQGDHRLSTLRRYVKALGGELSLVARFGKREVRLDV